MTRPALTLQDLRVLLSISAAKAGPNEDAVAVRAAWEQTFNSGDADKIAARPSTPTAQAAFKKTGVGPANSLDD